MGERKGEKKLQRGRKANHKRLLNTEKKLRVDGGWEGGESELWALRRALAGMSTGCCMEASLTINYIFKKGKKKERKERCKRMPVNSTTQLFPISWPSLTHPAPSPKDALFLPVPKTNRVPLCCAELCSPPKRHWSPNPQ